MTCPTCDRPITSEQLRLAYDPGDRDEPPSDFPGCVFCAPTEDDLARFENRRDEQRLSEARER